MKAEEYDRLYETRKGLAMVRSLLVDVGWTQNRYRKTDIRGKVTGWCITGACFEASRRWRKHRGRHMPDVTLWDIRQWIKRVLHEALNVGAYRVTGPDRLVEYNDDDGRTRQEMIDLVNQAIHRVDTKMDTAERVW